MIYALPGFLGLPKALILISGNPGLKILVEKKTLKIRSQMGKALSERSVGIFDEYTRLHSN